MTSSLRNAGWAAGLAALAFASAAASAPVETTTYTYTQGSLDFECSGVKQDGFHADGAAEDPTHCPPDAGGACIGNVIQSDIPGSEGVTLRTVGGVVNPNGTVDRIDITIIKLGITELVPGTYTVDDEETVLLVYYDDAYEFMAVPGLPPLVMSAERWFIASLGSTITLTEVNEDRVVGTFAGTMFDEDLPGESITIDQGMFTMERSPTPAVRVSWAKIKSVF